MRTISLWIYQKTLLVAHAFLLTGDRSLESYPCVDNLLAIARKLSISHRFGNCSVTDTIVVIASANETIPASPAGGSRNRHVRAPFDGAGLAITTFYQKTELLRFAKSRHCPGEK